MKTSNLGYPRIGARRELKRACENYWAGRSTLEELLQTGKDIRKNNWELQQQAGVDLIPSNDFSFYDQVLDMTLTVGAIPPRYEALKGKAHPMDLYFAMARGSQKKGIDVIAMEMTKWFDTNYHYIVPEFTKDQAFSIYSTQVVDTFLEAKALGIHAKPVLLGPISYLLLGKEKEKGFHRLELLPKLLPVYRELLDRLASAGATWIQLDEPVLALDLSAQELQAFSETYRELGAAFPQLQILLASYFGGYGPHLETVLNLPVAAIHLDLKRAPEQLDQVLESPKLSENLMLSLGVVDGRNVWKNHYADSLQILEKAIHQLGADRLLLSPSCSLLHVPCDLDQEEANDHLPEEVLDWLAFAKQKLDELETLRALALLPDPKNDPAWRANARSMVNRSQSALIHKPNVKARLAGLEEDDFNRKSAFTSRKIVQQQRLGLPPFATTTIGSFPQTTAVRQERAQYKKGNLSMDEYESFLKMETAKAIAFQEEIGLDVLVHGEFERNDMVEYFGEQLEGFVFTRLGWVQSYGSRCVKPPIIFGDVHRPHPMTVDWTTYAQSLTPSKVKGMLTGPVTILQWSFVRDDQPRATTCDQIALAILDEVQDLEAAGIHIIQVDEPAIREGLPLRKGDWEAYLYWATGAFRLATSRVEDSTQIHTHMCYSEFNDIIESIAAMDADVITIECSRSQMELLDAFVGFDYPNDIGPGVYDIHSPRVPSAQEMVALLQKAEKVLPASRLWVNPDCGLKTRGWEETKAALTTMVDAAKQMRRALVS